MDWLVCIDPGKSCGVAVFWGKALLTVVGLDPEQTEGRNHLRESLTILGPCQVVWERPGLRKGPRSSTPDDLIRLSYRAGLVVGCIPRVERIRDVTPAEWKGSLKKELSHRRTRAKLGPKELEVLGLAGPRGASDILDAVGLGLYVLGR